LTTGSLELASARVSARYGRRVDDVQWHRIEAPRTLAGVIDAVRASSLDAWVAGLTAASDAHDIDRHVRATWRDTVGEVARWMPSAWTSSVAWWSTLPDLPFVASTAQGREPPRWMHADPHYRPIVERAPVHPLARLVAQTRRHGDAGAAWLAEWRRRTPRDTSGWLDRLVALLARHVRTFRSLPPGDGTAARRALQPKLVMLMRHAVTTPGAVFAFLALTLIDAERLRGELVRRAAFPGLPLAP